jgi:hypothetical protein
MDDIQLRRELLDRGRTDFEITAQVRNGGLTRIRRGAYSPPLAADATAVARHRALIAATLRQVSDRAVLSHASAAVLHGLPTWPDQLDRVQITRDRAGGGRATTDLLVSGRPLNRRDVSTVDGLQVTSLARTVLDLACSQAIERGVATGDAALRFGLRGDEFRAVVMAGCGRHGIGRARAVLELADARSESVGESFSRVRFWLWGLPAPVLQFEVRDPLGRLAGRCDFGWPDLGTVGEFDGKIKYGLLLRPGESAQDVLLAEKRREERIRELGWQVVRWGWSDLSNRTDLVARLQQAFRRGSAGRG